MERLTIFNIKTSCCVVCALEQNMKNEFLGEHERYSKAKKDVAGVIEELVGSYHDLLQFNFGAME